MIPQADAGARANVVNSAYRPCVLGVFTNDAGQVLVGERKRPRSSWQFPQGGIDPGESPEAAIRREMREELGCGEVEILRRLSEALRYDFPADVTGPHANRFRGQEQVWFLLRFASGTGPDLARAVDDEFVALAWVSPAMALERAVDFKRAAYAVGLARLGLFGSQAEG